jgi:hypothetical protein
MAYLRSLFHYLPGENGDSFPCSEWHQAPIQPLQVLSMAVKAV